MTLVVEKWQEGWEGARISSNIACGGKKKHVKTCEVSFPFFIEVSKILRHERWAWGVRSTVLDTQILNSVQACQILHILRATESHLRNALATLAWFSPATRMKKCPKSCACRFWDEAQTLQTAELFAPVTQTCYSCARSWEETFLRDCRQNSCPLLRSLTASNSYIQLP